MEDDTQAENKRKQNCDCWTETAERDEEIRIMMMLRCQEGDQWDYDQLL